jgi:hypothetical protein
MPVVFEEDGSRFFFDSNEPEPIQVHAQHGGGEPVLDVEDAVGLRTAIGSKLVLRSRFP